jgi:phage regulator Rha-like protein
MELKKNETMSSREIAELTGKQHKDVLEAIRNMETAWEKVCGRKFPLTSNKVAMPNGGFREEPVYHLSKTECLYVATKFNDEARAKLVLRWEQLEMERNKSLSTLDILELAIKGMRENQQELQEVKKDVLELKAKITTRPEEYTIAGYAILNGMRVNREQASWLGKTAKAICRKRNIQTGSTHDPRFGKVYTYPVEILREVFDLTLIKN